MFTASVKQNLFSSPHPKKFELPHYQGLLDGTISGITILYKRDVVSVGAKLAQIERKRNAGSHWIRLTRGGGGSPPNRNSAASRFSLFSPVDQQLLSMQSAIYIWLAATVAAIGVIKRYGWLDLNRYPRGVAH